MVSMFTLCKCQVTYMYCAVLNMALRMKESHRRLLIFTFFVCGIHVGYISNFVHDFVHWFDDDGFDKMHEQYAHIMDNMTQLNHS